MRKIIVTGSAGLIGSETVRHFANEGYGAVGIDNDMRSHFFGAEASTRKMRDLLVKTIPGYEHHDLDIRDAKGVLELFKTHRNDIAYRDTISRRAAAREEIRALFLGNLSQKCAKGASYTSPGQSPGYEDR